MDVIGFSEAATANSRIEIINANPDSSSGIVTVPKTIASGETVTIPAGRTAILPGLVVEGDLLVEGTVFIPTGSTYTQETIKTEAISNVAGSTTVNVADIVSKVGDQTIAGTKTFSTSPTVPTTAAGDNSTKVATTAYVDGKFIRGTAVASTSGTSIDFTGIPAWAKRIVVMFNGVSLSGTSGVIVQLGNSSITSTGYSSSGSRTSGSVSTLASSIGFVIGSNTAAETLGGAMQIYTLGSNIWVSSHSFGQSIAAAFSGGGNVTLSGVLDRIRITTVNGTDTFDAGSINIMYEG